jgi:hypothetical protein
MAALLAFPSLMTCLGQKLSVFMLSHFFSALFNNTSQRFTSLIKILRNNKLIFYHIQQLDVYFFFRIGNRQQLML